MMEKSRLYILSGDRIEEPLESGHRLCRFSSLEVDTVAIDAQLSSTEPDAIDISRLFRTHKTKALRDVEHLLSEGRLHEAWKRAESHPHKKLFVIMADEALRRAEFSFAERCFVKYVL